MDDVIAVQQANLGPNRIAAARHGLFMYAAEDTVIGRALEVYGEFAEAEARLLTRLIEPGQVAVDVGANIGTLTVPLARRVGPTGGVVAFEPQRRVFTLLCANIALNGLAQVRPMPVALGAARGNARISAPKLDRPGNLGNTSLNNVKGGETVSVLTLDSYNLKMCALIKMDVEGMESAVLKGAASTIDRLRPIVYLEAHPGPNTTLSFEFLMARNYALYWHCSPFFRRSNFRNVREDIFRPSGMPSNYILGDVNALAMPRERPHKTRLTPISRPDADWRADLNMPAEPAPTSAALTVA